MKVLRWLVASVEGLKNAIKFIVIKLVGRPVFLFGKIINQLFILPIYKLYVPVKFAMRKRMSASKSILYPLMTRATLHVVIGVIAFAVVAQGVMARGVISDNFGQKSILGALALPSSDEGADIVETAEGATLNGHNQYLAKGGMVNISAAPSGAPEEDADDQTQLADGAVKNVSGIGGNERQAIESYTVLGGDTISTIAEKFGVSTRTILWANNLSDTSVIKPGDTLQIPPVSGVIHQVKTGDTLDSIAAKYKADAEQILAFNQLPTRDALQVGDVLIVPGGIIEQAPAAAAPTPSRYNFIDRIFNGPVPPPAKAAPGNRLLWPTPGHKINQYRTWRHTGIDIDGDYSSPLYAAADGRVSQVIYQRFGYGYHIIIDHGGGKQTLYGHASKIFVKPGQMVTRGQTIGMMGSTGRSTGTHLHFEVIVNGVKTNPLSYL